MRQDSWNLEIVQVHAWYSPALKLCGEPGIRASNDPAKACHTQWASIAAYGDGFPQNNAVIAEPDAAARTSQLWRMQ
jgi:hypothetical protein